MDLSTLFDDCEIIDREELARMFNEYKFSTFPGIADHPDPKKAKIAKFVREALASKSGNLTSDELSLTIDSLNRSYAASYGCLDARRP